MLPQLEAERQLLAIEAACVPHMTQQAGAGVLRRYEQRLGGDASRKSALEALTAAGIQIVREPKRTKAKRRGQT
jgi:hypothetical protein